MKRMLTAAQSVSGWSNVCENGGRYDAADYQNMALTDDKAKKMIDELMAIEKAEAKLKETFVPKLSGVLPAKKVARYLQIENKIRALVKYDLATGVPLVE